MNQTFLDALLAFMLGLAVVVTVVGLQTIKEVDEAIEELTDYRITTE